MLTYDDLVNILNSDKAVIEFLSFNSTIKVGSNGTIIFLTSQTTIDGHEMVSYKVKVEGEEVAEDYVFGDYDDLLEIAKEKNMEHGKNSILKAFGI